MPPTTTRPLVIRDADKNDIREIERMVDCPAGAVKAPRDCMNEWP